MQIHNLASVIIAHLSYLLHLNLIRASRVGDGGRRGGAVEEATGFKLRLVQSSRAPGCSWSASVASSLSSSRSVICDLMSLFSFLFL
jgi:hypothetical protein